MNIKRFADAAQRLNRAVARHGIGWTVQRSIALLRGKVAVHGTVGLFRRILTAPSQLHWSPALTDDKGVVPGLRVSNKDDHAFEIPFATPVPHTVRKVAVVAQIFYVEYAEEFLTYFRNITVPADLFIATDTPEKREALQRVFAGFDGGSVEFRVTPNRGRDIGPKLVGFRDVYDRYDYFLHVHSKRSPHGGEALSTWRKYLLDHLLGSREIVESNLALLTTNDIGLVFPQHLFDVRGVLNWGYDFNLAKALLARAGFLLTKDHLLEFPSGSMFWARSDALRKLLALGLAFDDFEEETGKVDGTLAHAIERSYLFFCESAGYKWAKVCQRAAYPLPRTLEVVASRDDIRSGLRSVFRSVLSRPLTVHSPQERMLPVGRRISVTPSDSRRVRLNLLIPTVNPFQVFGGVSTAIKIFDQLRARLGSQVDARIVVTDAGLDREALDKYRDYTIQNDAQEWDREPLVITDQSERGTSLSLRRGDVFMASAWWNAAHAKNFKRMQMAYFDQTMPFIYLIQDFEPNFSAQSSQWAAAECTYHDNADTIAVINSNELYRFMTQRYDFPVSYVLPYEPNAAVRAAIRPQPKEKTILVYGRPSVARNCFEVLVDGVQLWQITNPSEAAGWKIISLGETFPEGLAYPVQNFTVLGKVDLEEYGALLAKASIGVSLMLSPHPSYPPLEMAMAGMLTITNRFENKDLAIYSDCIVNLDVISPEDIAQKLQAAVERIAEGEHAIRELPALRQPVNAGPVIDYGAIAAAILDADRSWVPADRRVGS